MLGAKVSTGFRTCNRGGGGANAAIAVMAPANEEYGNGTLFMRNLIAAALLRSRSAIFL